MIATAPATSTVCTELTEQLSTLRSWDFSRIEAKLIRTGEAADQATATKMIEEYRRFIELVIRHPTATIPMAKPIDAVWHAHILATRDYAAFCEAVAGQFLHHSPNITDEEDAALDESYRTNTIGLYRHHFGEPAQKWWPHNDQCCTAPHACSKC